MSFRNVEIKTERLLLRTIEIKYAGEIFNEFTNEITAYMFPKPSENIAGVINFILSSINGMEEGK